MFDISFGELVLVFVVALVVLGPERLPHAIRSVTRFIRAARQMANGVKNELTRELEIQELQESLRKAEQKAKAAIEPELKSSVDEVKAVVKDIQTSYTKEPPPNNSPVTTKGDESSSVETPAVQSVQPVEKKAE